MGSPKHLISHQFESIFKTSKLSSFYWFCLTSKLIGFLTMCVDNKTHKANSENWDYNDVGSPFFEDLTEVPDEGMTVQKVASPKFKVKFCLLHSKTKTKKC